MSTSVMVYSLGIWVITLIYSCILWYMDYRKLLLRFKKTKKR